MSGVVGGVVVLAGFTAPSGIQTCKSAYVNNGNITTSVTSGKKIYVTDILFSSDVGGNVTLRDGGGAGTILFSAFIPASGTGTNSCFSHRFVVPLEVSTSVYMVNNGVSTFSTWTGFEQ